MFSWIRRSLVMIIALGALSGTVLVAQTSSAGQQVFTKYKCDLCHSIKSLGIASHYKGPEEKRPPDLSDAGGKHDAEWIAGWITKKIKVDGKKHQKRFMGSDEELKTLSEWLASQKHK